MNKEIEEILDITQEEAAEVIVAISKIDRFGIDNLKPGKPLTNREHLEVEIGDLLTMVDLLIEKEVISWKNIVLAKQAKREKLKLWSTIQIP